MIWLLEFRRRRSRELSRRPKLKINMTPRAAAAAGLSSVATGNTQKPPND